MTTYLYAHPACMGHDPGGFHPERPERLGAVLAALDEPALAGVERREAPAADPATLCLAHPEAHVERVMAAIPHQGHVALDADTIVGPGSKEAALRAAGAVCAAVDAVIAGEADNAFCAVRPPGHHAEPSRSMGFCLFNNLAIGAFHAREKHGLSRVAVVDFDVHHGNGTQAMFETDGDLFYASTHQWPLYPGTGSPDETGVGNIVNATLAPSSGSREFREAIETRVLPALAAFDPELLLISAGFDAHRDDPLGGLNLVDDDYVWVTEALCSVARDRCGGRVVSALEGGYDLDALARSAAGHASALMAAGEGSG